MNPYKNGQLNLVSGRCLSLSFYCAFTVHVSLLRFSGEFCTSFTRKFSTSEQKNQTLDGAGGGDWIRGKPLGSDICGNRKAIFTPFIWFYNFLLCESARSQKSNIVVANKNFNFTLTAMQSFCRGPQSIVSMANYLHKITAAHFAAIKECQTETDKPVRDRVNQNSIATHTVIS